MDKNKQGMGDPPLCEKPAASPGVAQPHDIGITLKEYAEVLIILAAGRDRAHYQSGAYLVLDDCVKFIRDALKSMATRGTNEK